MVIHVPPELNKSAFNCPLCQAYANQKWYDGVKYGKIDIHTQRNQRTYEREEYDVFVPTQYIKSLSVSVCTHCNKMVIWLGKNMLVPKGNVVPPPPDILSKQISEIYDEAARVFNESIRASGALIRLALEMLLQEVNNNKKKLYPNIELLENDTHRYIPDEVKKSLHIIRVNGNNLVHPGVIKEAEDRDNVLFLFELFNIITEDLIVRPKRIYETISKFPESIRKQIESDKGTDPSS